MEEKHELSTQVIIDNNEERGGVDEEEFYEKIEAPKFVDFTVPDPYRPDDRYWFCLRVGCDQKHEEEIDPEEVSKNFVLRVMAARSPYIRLRQILNRKASSVNEKCPLSAPLKPSKSSVSRLAVISSFSQKMVDGKGKSKPLSKIASTPKVKGKQVAAKYLTTPGNKNSLPKPNSFRSVQNPKPTSIAVPRSRMVVKSLVFHSPKKAISIKSSAELRTPLTKTCEWMKRLDISSQRKRILGYSNKSSKEIRRNPNNSLPVDSSKRNLSACKNKSKTKELFRSRKHEEKEIESSRCVKRESNDNSNKPCNSKHRKSVENKPMEGTPLENSGITVGKVCEGLSTNEKAYRNSDSMDSTQEEVIPCSELAQSTKTLEAVSSEASRGKMSFSLHSKEGLLEDNDLSKFQANFKEQRTESQRLGGVMVESDDKENASASDGNRDIKDNNNHSGRKILGKQEATEVCKKVSRTQIENLKEGLTIAATGAQGAKYKKPKFTNPKPFRLRTDERGILKEANLERKMRSVLGKENYEVSKLPAVNLQKRHGNEIQRNKKCTEEGKCKHDTHESRGKEQDTSLKKDEPKQYRTAGPRPSEEHARPKIATITRQRSSNSSQQKTKQVTLRFGHDRDVITQKSGHSLRKTKSSAVQGQCIRPKGVSSMRRRAMTSELVCDKQLDKGNIINTVKDLKKLRVEPSHCILSKEKGLKAFQRSQGFKIPHTPKCCTRKAA